MSTASFPHLYDVDLLWEGVGGATLSAPSRPSIVGGAPPEFAGKPSWWSPEHLLLSSLSLCLQTTFEAVARRARLAVEHYECRAVGVLDRLPTGLGFTALRLSVQVQVPPEQAERARELVLKAKQHCLVANSLVVPVELDVSVNGS